MQPISQIQVELHRHSASTEVTLREKQLTISGGKRGQELLDKIIDSKDFDWDGYTFESDKPKPPVLNPKSREYQLASQELQRMELEFRTASPEEKSVIFYSLQGHYHQPNMSEALIKAVAADYARILDGYPIKVMREAVDSFLLDTEQKFFPKVGQIKERMDSLYAKNKRRYKRLSMLVNGQSAEVI